MGAPGADRGTSDRGVDRAERVEAARDASVAAIYSGLNSLAGMLSTGKLTGDEVGVLLHHAASALERFDTAPGPLTQQVIAEDLLDTYRLLQNREATAPRGLHGELLKEVRSIGGTLLLPWTPGRPARLEDVADEGSSRPFFSSINLDRFNAARTYRAPAPATGGRRTRPPQPPSAPFDSSEVHAFNLTLVRGKGKAARRETLPWPLPKLVVPNAYRIDLVKGPEMSFRTRPGRIKILAYLLQVLGETNPSGHVYSEETGEYVEAEAVAKFIIETGSIGRLLFEGPESAFKVFEHAEQGYATDFLVTDEFIRILWYYTKLKPKFQRHDKPEAKRGCASIEWITELLKDVPHSHKQLWIQDLMISSAKVIFPDNLAPGMVVPAQLFLTEKVAEALGNEEHNVLFIGSMTANDRIILTEDGRVWLVKVHERNVQAFCEAVMQLQGLLTLSFILCTAVGAVLGGALVGFLITAGDVAIQVNEAGGIRAFVRDLRNHPAKAALFMLDLTTMFLDAKGIRTLLTNPVETLEASIKRVEAGVKSGRALPDAVEGVGRGVGDERRMAGGATAAQAQAHAAKTDRLAARETTRVGPGATATGSPRPSISAETPPVKDARGATRGTEPHEAPSQPTADARGAQRTTEPPHGSGRPTTEARGANQGVEAPHPGAETTKPPREPADTQIEVTDAVPKDGPAAKEDAAAKEGAAAQDFEEVLDAGRRSRPRPAGKRARERRSGGGGEKVRGKRRQQPPGLHPLRANARAAASVADAKDALQTLVGKNKAASEAASKLARLNGAELAKDIAEEYEESVGQGRKLLEKVAALADEEIQGLAAARRALVKEPIVRKFKGATSELEWFDLLHVPREGRADLLKLLARVEPAVDSGLSKALARLLESGEFSLQGGLGHFHAAAYLIDEYGPIGIRMVMEEPVYSAKLGLREVDIRATVADSLLIDVEVKTYLGRLVIYEHVRSQIVKDLVRHMDGSWENLRYLFSPNLLEDLHVFKQAIVDAFHTPTVRNALAAHKFDEAAAFETLQRRLDETVNPLVDVYQFAVPR